MLLPIQTNTTDDKVSKNFMFATKCIGSLIHKMLVRIRHSEGPDQSYFDLGLQFSSEPFS